MKIVVAAAALTLLTAPAFAQSASTSGSQAPSVNNSTQATNPSTQQGQAAAQKIKQYLQREGFTDVKVVAESFVVQGKSPDGDPVVMTIGPHGMSVFEAMNGNGSNSGTVGSSNGGQSSSGSGPSTNSNSGTPQK